MKLLLLLLFASPSICRHSLHLLAHIKLTTGHRVKMTWGIKSTSSALYTPAPRPQHKQQNDASNLVHFADLLRRESWASASRRQDAWLCFPRGVHGREAVKEVTR
ncbi:hypothetical protein HDV57DRAFT_420324 [Trichoderma longibrachiatum]